ncbi:MAG: hypothetical protein ACKONH_08780 [Planctomycetia bacterium]
MAFYPNPEPLSEVPDPARYERILLLAGGMGAGSDTPQAWSIEDAAAFWLPGWGAPSADNDTLPAEGIMGLATRALLSLCADLPPIKLLCTALGALPRFVHTTEAPYRGVSPHGFCYAAHVAFAPNGQAIREQLQDTGYRALAETHGLRCDEPSCRVSESMLGRCLPGTIFDNARRAGLLLPTRQIDASPLTLLITRLSSWRTQQPYIAVRHGADHMKRLYCPYWVHDAIVNLARIIPALLTDHDRQALIRFTVAKHHADCIADLHMPLRGVIVCRDVRTGNYGHPHIDRRAAAVEHIWRFSGAASGVTAMLSEPSEMWFGKERLF